MQKKECLGMVQRNRETGSANFLLILILIGLTVLITLEAQRFLQGKSFFSLVTDVTDKQQTQPPSEEEIETKLRLAEQWQNGGKVQSLQRLNQMKDEFDTTTSCPAWHYAKSVARNAKAAIIKFEQALGRDDYINVSRFEGEAEDAIRRLTQNRRWQQGVSKGQGTHLHSGSTEGSWLLDAGYVWRNGRAVREFRCPRCNAYGRLNQTVTCSSCNGRGRVPNPQAQLSDTFNQVSGLVGMFSKGRTPRVSVPSGPREITCGTCNGRGQVSTVVTCDQCGGEGKVYE
ncbi:MAG: hypothetical protein J5985_08280 [Kiritimatiellae bacterium]|nr:hypothetical protein [Kiritimatiellia bacterium]